MCTLMHTSIVSFSWVIIREGQFETLVGSVDLEGKTSHRTVCFNKSKIHRPQKAPLRRLSFRGNNREEVLGLFPFDKATGRYHRCTALGSAVVTPDEKGESLGKGNEI